MLPKSDLARRQVFASLFIRSASISLLQSSGIVFLSHRSSWAVATSFLIAWVWCENSRKVVDCRQPGTRFWYGAGGGAGAAIVLLVSYLLGAI